jgi:hypothetical protein
MKPQNVIDHEHFFINEDDDGNGPRFDACLTRDNGAGIWSPQTGLWHPMKSYNQARKVAAIMASLYLEYFTK